MENCYSFGHTYGRRYLNDMEALEKSHEWLVQVREQPLLLPQTPNAFWQVSQESLRLAQQSITLRKAMAPFDFVSERGSNRCRRN